MRVLGSRLGASNILSNLILITALRDGFYCHFKDRKTEAPVKWSKVTQVIRRMLVRNKAVLPFISGSFYSVYLLMERVPSQDNDYLSIFFS